MYITKERTRLIFEDYDEKDKKKLDRIVSTQDRIFSYEDVDNHKIYLPTGLVQEIQKRFPEIHIGDNSSSYWPFNNIPVYEHSAQPRNQLQIDFIKFIIEQANKKQKLVGVLSPGTGKAQPLSTNIPTPNGYKDMGDLKVGEFIYGSRGNPIKIVGVYEQGIKDIYKLTLSDGRTTRCCLNHLWDVSINGKPFRTIPLKDIIIGFKENIYNIPISPGTNYSPRIKNIELISREPARCIRVDADNGLYLTNNDIVTHNTFMACYSAIKVGARTLIIVPTSNIKYQWTDTLTNMFNIPSDKVLTVNSPKDFMNVTTDFTVVSQSSLATLNKTHDLEKIMEHNKFGIKIIDEVQMWFHNIIKIDGSSNICHNWYLTGTFGRSSEDENNLYHTMFGDLEIFREKEKTPTMFNQRPGNIYGQKPHVHTTMCWTKPKVLTDLTPEEKRKVINSWKYSEKSNQWSRIGINIPLYTEYAIPSNGKMTKYLHNLLELVKQANRQVTYGKMLILVPTIAATETVAKHVREMYPDLLVGTIHSRNKKTDNDYIKQSADILVSTAASAGTGFDCPGLSKMIMAQQLKSWILTEQCFGRLRRRPDGKDCYYWDIVDADQDMKQLVAWANVRADILKRRSKTFHVIDM